MTAPPTDSDLAAMEARAEARVRWCEWAPTRLAPPSEFCGAACSVRCDGCAVTRCAAHAVECDGSCVHAWTTLDESAADLRAALAEVRRLGALRLRNLVEHTQESLRLSARRIELYERIVALEAQAKGERPTADVLAGELARAVAQGGAATFEATAEGVAYVVTVTRRDAT